MDFVGRMVWNIARLRSREKARPCGCCVGCSFFHSGLSCPFETYLSFSFHHLLTQGTGRSAAPSPRFYIPSCRFRTYIAHIHQTTRISTASPLQSVSHLYVSKSSLQQIYLTLDNSALDCYLRIPSRLNRVRHSDLVDYGPKLAECIVVPKR